MIPYIPWPSARKVRYFLYAPALAVEFIFYQFKAAVDTMHPVYQTLFEGKKATYLEGGVAALEESATGGKDLMTILCTPTCLDPYITRSLRPRPHSQVQLGGGRGGQTR